MGAERATNMERTELIRVYRLRLWLLLGCFLLLGLEDFSLLE